MGVLGVYVIGIAGTAAFVLAVLHVFGVICLKCLSQPELVIRYEGNDQHKLYGRHVMYQVCKCGEVAVDERVV